MSNEISINPEWQMAPLAYGIIHDGQLINPHTFRWKNIEDANHDFDRMERGLPPERNVPRTISEVKS